MRTLTRVGCRSIGFFPWAAGLDQAGSGEGSNEFARKSCAEDAIEARFGPCVRSGTQKSIACRTECQRGFHAGTQDCTTLGDGDGQPVEVPSPHDRSILNVSLRGRALWRRRRFANRGPWIVRDLARLRF